MDLSLTVEQQELVENVRAFFGRESPTVVVRAAEPLGFDERVWVRFAELGGALLGVAEDRGGSGASLLDLELLSEEAGAALAPIPSWETWVAARALATAGPSPEDPLAELSQPDRIATLALRPPVDGVCRLVPAGAVATMVVYPTSDGLRLLSSPAPGAAPPNLGCSPLADRSVATDTAPLLSGPAAAACFDRARSEARCLLAGQLVGLATSAVGLGVDYAKERHQFGVPIGSFQSIAHGLADVATEVAGARLLAREAAWAQDAAPEEHPHLAAMALLQATVAARRASSFSLHVHGGYGFCLEYDIQLHHRRAQAWPLAFGDPRRGSLALADLLLGPMAEAG